MSGNIELLFRSLKAIDYEEYNKGALGRLGQHRTFKSRALQGVREGKGLNNCAGEKV
jgi:hypothetical protein